MRIEEKTAVVASVVKAIDKVEILEIENTRQNVTDETSKESEIAQIGKVIRTTFCGINIDIYIEETYISVICEPFKELHYFNDKNKALLLETILRINSLSSFSGRYVIGKGSNIVTYIFTLYDNSYINYDNSVNKQELFNKLSKSFLDATKAYYLYEKHMDKGISIKDLVK